MQRQNEGEEQKKIQKEKKDKYDIERERKEKNIIKRKERYREKRGCKIFKVGNV